MSFLLPRSKEVEQVRKLLAPAAKHWNETVREPVPDDMLAMLAKLK